MAKLIRESDVCYATVDGIALFLDVLTPAPTPAERRPGIVFVHGGGWIGGDKTTTSNNWLAEAGFFTVSVQYRLTDVAPFPAQIRDVKAAIRWVRANADRYGVDPARIGIWGSSAGGHLAALCACTNGGAMYDDAQAPSAFSSDVQCAVPICPPTDFLIDWYAVNGMPVHGDAEMCIAGLLGGSILQNLELARMASPLWHVSARTVPQLIIHGAQDDLVPVGQVRAYASALLRHGVPVEYLEFPDEGHAVDAGIFTENADPHGLRARILQFFQTMLG